VSEVIYTNRTHQGDEVEVAGAGYVHVIEYLAEALGLQLADQRLHPGLMLSRSWRCVFAVCTQPLISCAQTNLCV
jgi:hypothetical protein